MKKHTVLVICILLLCGGLFHFYLAAQTKEAGNKAKELTQSLMQPIPVDALPTVHFLGEPLPIVEPDCEITGNPYLMPVFEEVVEADGTRRTVERTAMMVPTPHPDPFSYSLEVPVKSKPDIGKFRMPIEYKLTNIPAASLKEFLTEQFDHVEAADPKENEAGTISITASLEDHRAIKHMLIEIEREIETLRSDAADETKTEERKIVVFSIKHTSARSLLKHVEQITGSRYRWGTSVTVDDRTNSLVVIGTSSQIADVEALLQKLDTPVPKTMVQKSPWDSWNR